MPRSHPRVVLAGVTEAERRRRRKGLRLRDFTIAPQTRLRYESAVGKVIPFLRQAPAGSDSFDGVLCDYIELAWSRGESLGYIADMLSGLHFFMPHLRGTLREAWRLFKSWRRIESPVRAPPITPLLVRAFVADAVARRELRYAALLCLGFHCLLRTGELLEIRFGDLEIGERTGVLTLKSSKSGLRTGAMEAVAIRDPITLELVNTLLLITPHFRGDLLWPHSGQSFRNRFRLSCERFRVAALAYKPYSLRRGGATMLLQANLPMELILVKGRWRSVGVARLYLEDGLAQLPALRLSPEAMTLVTAAANATPSTAFWPC